MIKKIIFDIDDTLIDFPRQYVDGYQEVLNKYNLNINFMDLYNAIGKYETSGKYEYYDIDKLIKLVNSELNLNLDRKFSNDFFKMYDKLITPVSQSTIDTLEYLSKKYELVTLSNWFTSSQTNRLKEAGIFKYFTNVYGTDKVPMKPKKESFQSAMGNLKAEECVMVGDNFNVDIKVPKEMGLNVYYLSKNKKEGYNTINSISELKELL